MGARTGGGRRRRRPLFVVLLLLLLLLLSRQASSFSAPSFLVGGGAGRVLGLGWRLAGPRMTLHPIGKRELRSLIPLRPRKVQLLNWLGQSSLQRQGRVAEEAGLGLLWLWFAFFLSRTAVLGRIVAPLFTFLLLIRWGVAPWLTAFRTNMDLRMGGGRKRIAALYSGRVQRCGEMVAPARCLHHIHFRMVVTDDEDRELTFEVPMLPAYRRVGAGMRCMAVVLADEQDQQFEEVIGVTEVYVPSADVSVGAYPFLEERRLQDLINRHLRRERNQRHSSLKSSRARGESSGTSSGKRQVSSAGRRPKERGSG
jgi:hypothetical protein